MQDSVSERVLSIIAATQRIPRDRITLDSSFEELGFDSLEFWQGREDRLHDRIRFVRDLAGWTRERLQP